MENTNNIENKTFDLICVACPKGCRLEVQRGNGDILVSNAGCKRGKEYAVGEINDPRRMVASTVRVHNGLHPLIPVYTEAPFPKDLISDLLKEIRRVEITAPIKCGQVIIKDALKTGIDVIASRDI
jgi:CxxC motif-containing protein